MEWYIHAQQVINKFLKTLVMTETQIFNTSDICFYDKWNLYTLNFLGAGTHYDSSCLVSMFGNRACPWISVFLGFFELWCKDNGHECLVCNLFVEAFSPLS